MKRLLILALPLLLLGCRTHKEALQVVEEHTEQRLDSVRIEYIERIVYVPDTVYIEIPDQRAERETPDSTSFLENDYAWSFARITPEGTLFHALNTKPQSIAVGIETPVKEITRNESHISQYQQIDSSDRQETITEYIEKDLSWWQRTQIYGFWAALSLLLISWRRPIIKAVRWAFTKK